MNELSMRTSPILIYDIDPELDEFLKENREISIDQYIQENVCFAKKNFRAIRLSKFIEPSQSEFESHVTDAFTKFGSAFLNPNFFKTFAVTYPPGFHEEFPKYRIQKDYKLDRILFNSNPWFDWLKDYVFKALTFSKGMLTDFPFCFLFFYPYSKISECNSLIQEILSRDLPNIHNFPDPSENRKYYQNYSRFAFVLFKSKTDSEVKEEFDKTTIYKIFLIEDNFKKDLSNFVQQLYMDKFFIPHEELKKKIDNPKKKLFGSRSASQADFLMCSVQLFSLGRYEDLGVYIQSLDDKQSLYKKHFYFINLMKTIYKIKKSGDELNERIQALKDMFIEDPNSPMPFSFLLLNAVLFFVFIENKNEEQFIRSNDIVKQNLNKIVKLTEKNLASYPTLMDIACGVWYDQIYVLHYRSDQQRKVPLNLLMAARHYRKAGMNGHVLRCYAFLQAVLCKTSKSSKSNKNLTKMNDTFECGRIKDNVYLPLQTAWQSLACFALWKLSKTLAITKQYQSALQLNIILLAAPKCGLVPDRKIFSVLHAYFNFLNIDQLILQSLPLVLIDQRKVKFAEYGGFAFKNYNQSKFDHLLQHHRKKFKVVRDNLQMWRKSKFQCDEVSVPIVCGEKNAIIIPFSNRRTTEISLSNLSLIDSNSMITSSCMENDPSLKSNEMVMIPINFLTNKTGPFSITGISFIYWAIIKDTLQLTPFKFIALDNQPSLEATLINFPEQMRVGECCSFTCRLRNFGTADMTNVVFVHDAPFSISFENVRDWRMMNGSVSVSLLNQKLKPNESVDVPCYIRGRKPGIFKIKMIFSFLANLPLRWRFFPDKRNIMVIERDSFECKILDHPLSTSKKLVYINGTSAEKKATIKNVSILGCKTISNKEEIIPPNSSLSCVREVETIPQAISVAAISSATLRSIAPTQPPLSTSNSSQGKLQTQMIKASSANLNSLLISDSEIASAQQNVEASQIIESSSDSDSPSQSLSTSFDSIKAFDDQDSLSIAPRMRYYNNNNHGKNMPISFSSSLKTQSKDDNSVDRSIFSPSLSLISPSSAPTTQKASQLKNIQIQSMQRPSFQKQAHMSFDPSSLKAINSLKKDWREQFLAFDEGGYVEVDTQDNLRSQFNIDISSGNNKMSYTYEISNNSKLNVNSMNSVLNDLNYDLHQNIPKGFSLRGTLSAPSIIKFDENETVEVVLKLKNVGSCDTPLLTISPRVPNSNQLFWVSKISHRLKPLKPEQEITLSFYLLVCNPGVFDVGYFVFKSKMEEQILHFTHILSVY